MLFSPSLLFSGADDSRTFIGVVKFILKVMLSSRPMTTRDIIKKLGGPVSVGWYLGINSQAVSHWSSKDRIPAARVPELMRLCNKLGVRVTPKQMRPDIDWRGMIRDESR
jgi:DNA-binding transcriptional regulator YdaS (Cro superfamily)